MTRAKRLTSLLILFCFFAQIVLGQEKVFFGNLHSHTSYSDGSGTPREAYTFARDVAKLDCQGALRRCHQHPLLPAREAYLRPFVSGARSDNSPQVTRASKNFNISGSPGKCLLKNALAEAACEKKAVTFVSS
jgi:hypothetical protein